MTTPDQQLPIQWQFVEVNDGRERKWLWRRLVIDGAIAATSQAFDNYGAAVLNAIESGFRPMNEKWATISTTGVTVFDPVRNARPVNAGNPQSAPVHKAQPRTTAIRKKISLTLEKKQPPRTGGAPRPSKSAAAGKPRRSK
jgi:hypothetical protein